MGEPVTELTDDDVMAPAPGAKPVEMNDAEVMRPPSPPNFADPGQAAVASQSTTGRVMDVLWAGWGGAKEGWGSQPLGMSDDDVKWMTDKGLFRKEQNEGLPTFFRAFNELLFYRGSQLLDAAVRTPNAVYHALGDAALAAGVPRDIVALPEAFLGSPHPTGMFRQPTFGEMAEASRPPSSIGAVAPDVAVKAAKDLGVVGPERPEPTFADSPSELAERAVPRDLNSAVSPEEVRQVLGHERGEYDARGKEWIDKIDAPADVQDVIEKIAGENDFFPEARGGVASAAARDAVAEAAGVNPAEIDQSYFSTHFDSDGKVRAVIHVLRQTAKDYADAAKKAVDDPTPENLAASAEAELRANHAVEYTMGLRAESGRTLAAWKDLLRQTEETRAKVALRSKETTGDVPAGVADIVDAAGDVRENLKNGKPPGLNKLLDAARALVDNADKPLEPGKERASTPEVDELVSEARNVLRQFGDGDKTKLDKLVVAAEKQAADMTKQRPTKEPTEALPPELKALVDKTKRVVDSFGGIARGERAALLLARTGRTFSEQEELARSVSGLTPNQVANVLNKLRTSPEANKPGWFYWIWQQGLISGLVTHTKYLAVNTTTVFLERVLSPLVGAVIDRARGGNASLSAPLYANVAMVHAMPDAVSAAAQAFKTGMRVPLESEMRLFQRGEESPQTKGAGAAYVQKTSPDWGIWNKVFNETQLDKAAAVLGIPGRSANMIHTFYKVLSERASASSRAFETAHQEGATGDAFWQRYRYHLDHPTDDALRGAVNDAYTGAFMAKLGPKMTTFAHALSKNPVTKWLFPFQHIPWNIERMSVEYSPFAILGPEMRSAILGKKGAPAQNLAIAKMAVGSSVLGYFMHKTLSGDATGDYPPDPEERRKWEMLGIRPNSIKIGGQWVSYERLGPMGNVAHMGAIIGEIVKHYDGQDDDAMTKAIWAASIGAANQVGNETGFQSLRNVIDSIENENKATRFAAYQSGSFMPMSSFTSQLASANDPYMRKFNSIAEGLKYRIPVLRETLLPKRDPVYGEPVPNPSYHTVNPMAPINLDPVKAEMARANLFPAAPQDRIGGVKLSPKLYDQYQAVAGGYAKEMLSALTQSPGWYEQPAYFRKKAMETTLEAARRGAATAMQVAHPELLAQGVQQRVDYINGASPTARPKKPPEVNPALMQ